MPELNLAGAREGIAWQSRAWRRLANQQNSTIANALSERIPCQFRALSRLKDCEVIAVVDENAPEEPRGQVTVETLRHAHPFGCQRDRRSAPGAIRVGRCLRPAVARPKRSAAFHPHPPPYLHIIGELPGLVFKGVEQDSHVRAGVEQQANGPQAGGERRRDDEQTAAVCLSPSKQRDTRPLHLCADRGRVIETEQAVCIIDQRVEVFEKIVAQNALKVEIGQIEVLEVINEHLLVGNSVGADFDQVDLG